MVERVYWNRRLAPLGQRIITLSRLLEMASYNMDRSAEEARKTGQQLLLDAAAEAEELQVALKDVVEEIARNGDQA